MLVLIGFWLFLWFLVVLSGSGWFLVVLGCSLWLLRVFVVLDDVCWFFCCSCWFFLVYVGYFRFILVLGGSWWFLVVLDSS